MAVRTLIFKVKQTTCRSGVVKRASLCVKEPRKLFFKLWTNVYKYVKNAHAISCQLLMYCWALAPSHVAVVGTF